MFCTITSGAVFGVSAYLVRVEVDIDRGLPTFSMVGLLGSEVRESRQRVCVALKNVGLDIPPTHITVNLSPADRKKEGTAFDLPIAVGILVALGKIPEMKEPILFLGELGLNGEIKPVPGVLPIVREAAKRGFTQCIVSKENEKEGGVIPGITVRGVDHIRELVEFFHNPQKREEILPAVSINLDEVFQQREGESVGDFGEISEQESGKRAALIAAAGFHNLLMLGPPGVGKSMIAKRIPAIMPKLTLEESLEVTTIMSVAGMLKEGESLVTERPFYAPHHTISQVALTGGSSLPKPGMISLAHRGVLFLDELPEFKRLVLDSMRQPIEEHMVHISRNGGTVTYPANFMLVAAMNPCPCGFYPDKNKCRCTENQVKRYMGHISGPVLDRMDLCVELQRVEVQSLQKRRRDSKKSDNNYSLRKKVMEARTQQQRRFLNTGYQFNSEIKAADIECFCRLGKEETKYMKELYGSLALSARGYHRILKVARTIADLEGEEEIAVEHLLEAACYRPAQEYWSGK